MPCAKLLMGWPPPRMFSKLKFTKFSSPEFSITLRNLEIIIVGVAGWEKWHTKKVVIWFFKFLTTKGAGSIDFQWMTGRFSRQIEDYLPNNWELDGARLVYHWNNHPGANQQFTLSSNASGPSISIFNDLVNPIQNLKFLCNSRKKASPKMWTIFASLVVMMCQWTFLLQLF